MGALMIAEISRAAPRCTTVGVPKARISIMPLTSCFSDQGNHYKLQPR